MYYRMYCNEVLFIDLFTILIEDHGTCESDFGIVGQNSSVLLCEFNGDICEKNIPRKKIKVIT